MSKLIKGQNDLLSQYPEIAAEWDYEGNFPLSPEEVAYSSNKQYWWICSKGHHFQTSPNSRTTKRSGCKYCSNKAVLKGYNDLAYTHPSIAAEWDYSKNVNDSPEEYTAGSDKKFYWICPNGHESYLASIKKRTAGGGCPRCARQKAGQHKTETIIKTKGSIKDLYPDLATEWDYEKNGLGPESFPAQSAKRVWWICSWCKNSWNARVSARTILNSGCPKCNHRNKTSFPEQAIYYYIKQIYPDAQNSFTESFDNKMELDVFIPSLSIGIEYDGVFWHNQSRKKKDQLKYHLCQQNGIKLLRIRESKEDASDICDHYIIRDEYLTSESLDKAINEIIALINATPIDISINTERDRNTILAQYYSSLKENSLQAKYPDIAAEWHPDKNGAVKPDMVAAHSQELFWWVCSVCGNEYKKRISDRTCSGRGCNLCSARKKSKWKKELSLKSGVNDIATLYPELIKEWDYSINTTLSPYELTAGSADKATWICSECGNKWVASVYSRTQGHGCPKCGRRKTGESEKKKSIQKHGSLTDSYPEVAAQWDYDLNCGITPDQISPIDRSHKYHWICKCGTKWEATVYSLTHAKYIGCRKCRYIQIGQYRKEHPEANPFYGKKHTNDSKAKIGASSKGEKNYWYGKKGRLSPNYGKSFSEDHKAKISASLKGKAKSDETKAKLSAAKTGKMTGADNPASKPVRQLTKEGLIVAEYDSIKAAERALGIEAKASKIGDVCRGKRKSAYGFLWEYICK